MNTIKNTIKIILKQKTLWLLLAILAIAAFFRFYNLTDIPPGLYPDVAINGNDALQALKTGDLKLFYPENNGREGLFINLIALSFWLFGASIWAIKIVPAIFGLLTVLGLYFLTKQLFSYLNARHTAIIALLATFFMAISFWHVNFSRLGFRAIMVPFFLVWSFYFLYKGLSLAKIHSSWTFACFPLAGLFFGLGFHTYIAFRVAPLILLVPIIFSLIRYWPKLKHFWRSKISFWHFVKKSYFHDIWWLWDIFFLVTILAALPMAVYFWQHPADFMGRTGQVAVFASENPIKTLLVSVTKSLGMFNVWGDCNWRHNYACQPELFWPIGILFLIGLIISLVKICRPANYKQSLSSLREITRRVKIGSVGMKASFHSDLTANYKEEHSLALETHWTLMIWFAVMLLPEVMTSEGLPHSLRSIGAIPPVFIWTGLGAWWLAQKIKPLLLHKNSRAEKIGLMVIFIVFLAMFSLAEFTRYFIDWGQRAEVRDSFTQRLVNEAKYLNSLPSTIQKFVMINESGVAVPYPNGLPMPVQTILFFNQQTPNIKYLVKDTNERTNSIQPVRIKDQLVFLPMRPDQQIFASLAKLFPNGRTQKISDFEVFKVNF
ncbi:glycosyltransferase family 39 protein [Patescibacteria group bacterium]|nr:glycosyltransferase family 39 protein [Patescibacteria group bacterium]